MKKILYIVAAAFLLSACTKWNENNFAGYEDRVHLNNVKVQELILSYDDYSAMAKVLSDEAKTKSGQDSLNLIILADSVTKGKSLPNGYTIELIGKYLKSLQATKFKSLDPKSEVVVSFRDFINPEVDKLSSSEKYTIDSLDYISMGTAAGYPGRYLNFEIGIDPLYFIPLFLKNKFGYSKVGEVKAITYKFYLGTQPPMERQEIFVYDGNTWNVQLRQARFAVTQSYDWEYVNTLLLFETFYDNLGSFTPVSVVGEKAWVWDSYHYAKMTEYYESTNHDGDDWLISPSIDLSGREFTTLSFVHVARYLSSEVTFDCSVWVSTTYDGSGNIDTLQWTEVAIPNLQSSSNWTYYNSGRIALHTYVGNDNFHFAFRYRSTVAAAGTWEIKDVLLEATE